MKFQKSKLARLSVSLGLVTVMGISAALPAFAAGDTGVTVSGGSLAGGALTYTDFTTGTLGETVVPITLNGTAKFATANFAIANMVDSRGSGAGWNVSLTLTQFKEYATGAYVTDGHALATSSLKVTTSPVVSQVDATSSATNTITPVTNTTALDTGSAVKVLSASTNGGMGSFSFTPMTSTLSVPANTFAATYKSDATISLNATP